MARPRQITDEQIVEATRTAVMEHGAQVSLDLVAQRLGVTSPALLKRYGSRQALLVAALCPDPAEIERVFDTPIDDRPFQQQVEALLDRLSSYFSRMYPRVMALRECGLSNDRFMEQVKKPLPVVAIGGMSRWLAGMHARGLIDGGLRETAATALVGAVSTRMMSAYLTKRAWSRRSQLAYQRELSALFARALAVEPPRRATTLSKSKKMPSNLGKKKSRPARRAD